MITVLKGVTLKERLKALNVCNLHKRQLKESMISIHKYWTDAKTIACLIMEYLITNYILFSI